LDFTTDREGFAVDNWTDISPRISAFPCQLLLHHFQQSPPRYTSGTLAVAVHKELDSSIKQEQEIQKCLVGFIS